MSRPLFKILVLVVWGFGSLILALAEETNSRTGLPIAEDPGMERWELGLEEGLVRMLQMSHSLEMERLKTEISGSKALSVRSKFSPRLIIKSAYAERQRRLNQFTTDTTRSLRISDDIISNTNTQQVDAGGEPIFEGFEGELDPTLVPEDERENFRLPDPADLLPREYYEKIRNSRMGIDWLLPTGTLLSASVIELRRTDDFITELTPNGLPLSPFAPYQQEFLARLSVTQPLLQDFGLKPNLAELRLGKAQKSVADAVFFENVTLQIGEFLKGYFRLRVYAQAVDAYAQSVEAATGLYKEAQRLEREGLTDIVEVTRLKSLIARRELLWIGARADYYAAQQAVQVMLSGTFHEGMENTILIPTGGFPKQIELDPKVSVRAHVDDAFGNDIWIPVIAASKARMTSAQIRSDILVNEALPRFDLDASYGTRGIGSNSGEAWDDMTSGQHPEWQVGISFQMPLGTSLIKGKLAEANAEKALATAGFEAATLEFSSDIAVLRQRILFAKKKVEEARKTAEASGEALRVESLKLAEGKSRVSLVRELQQELLLSRLLVLQTQNELQQHTVDFHATKGDLLPELGVNVISGGHYKAQMLTIDKR